MKTLLTVIAMLFALSSFANNMECLCDAETTVDSPVAAVTILTQGQDVASITLIKYERSISEIIENRRAYGTSCEGSITTGAKCTSSRTGIVKVKMSDCSATLRVVATSISVKAAVLKSSCDSLPVKKQCTYTRSHGRSCEPVYSMSASI